MGMKRLFLVTVAIGVVILWASAGFARDVVLGEQEGLFFSDGSILTVEDARPVLTLGGGRKFSFAPGTRISRTEGGGVAIWGTGGTGIWGTDGTGIWGTGGTGRWETREAGIKKKIAASASLREATRGNDPTPQLGSGPKSNTSGLGTRSIGAGSEASIGQGATANMGGVGTRSIGAGSEASIGQGATANMGRGATSFPAVQGMKNTGPQPLIP